MLLARWSLAAEAAIDWRCGKGEAFDERFRGYEVELTLIQPIGQAMFYPWQIDAAGHPGYRAEPSGELAIISRPSEHTAILRMRVRREPRIGFLEGWWERNLRAIRWSIRDIDEKASANDLYTLLKLPRTSAKRGRPFGRMYRDRDGFIAVCEAAKANLPPGRRITQDAMACELNIGARTLRDTLQEYGIKWDDIVGN